MNLGVNTMSKVTKCSIIIFDDFNNILLCQRGKGKNPKNLVWSTFGNPLTGRQTTEKCITKTIDKDLKCNIFNLQPFKEYSTENPDEIHLVYTGNIKEQMTYNKDIVRTKWFSLVEIEQEDILPEHKDFILEFFSAR